MDSWVGKLVFFAAWIALQHSVLPRLGVGTPMPPMWIFYLETSNLDAAIARATKKGAKRMNGPMAVPGGARIAQLTAASVAPSRARRAGSPDLDRP